MQHIMKGILLAGSNRQEVKIADLSQSGMRIYVDSYIARGTSVHIEYEHLAADAIVWHSRRFRGAYLIGVEFQSVNQVSGQEAVTL